MHETLISNFLSLCLCCFLANADETLFSLDERNVISLICCDVFFFHTRF